MYNVSFPRITLICDIKHIEDFHLFDTKNETKSQVVCEVREITAGKA